jgi:hypothetical protein
MPPLRGSTRRASGGTRTHNLLITNQLLCQLSYAGAGSPQGEASQYTGAPQGRKVKQAEKCCNRWLCM